MEARHCFELLKEQNIGELKTKAQLFRHIKTGAEFLSLSNHDSNKVFGITFRTPPTDSTGVAHILEHSVLCGSQKYPVKEPFVELLKGSLQTFLNAMTYPDKTCYPFASQNLKDFYNLMDVYLDAVFYPRITPFIFQQEGWHYEQDSPESAVSCKGVVFNEMKGAYSSAESLLAHYSQQSLFPDNTYGLDSGGDPEKILDLTYDQFKEFHRRYYHPSNCRIYIYGDDDPQERLRFINQYLKDFDPILPDSQIPLQPLYNRPKQVFKEFPAGDIAQGAPKGLLTVNWLLTETRDVGTNMALSVLEYILLGMPASPLRKALIDSGLGDGIAGIGLEDELRQMYFSTGLKGIDVANAAKVETLILETLSVLCQQGIDQRTVDAAMNTIEFRLRENNSGHYPQGLFLMLRSLTTWLCGEDPFSLLAFEQPLNQLKSKLSSSASFFEGLIKKYFLENHHRSLVVLTPDPDKMKKQEKAEKKRIEAACSLMGPDDLQKVLDNTRELKRRQQTPDPPESLATIPRLTLSDLDRKNACIPLECSDFAGTKVLFHDLFTSDIFYADIGLDLHLLPQKYLPYVPLLGRAFLETGTEKEDFVALTQRISSKTGGIKSSIYTSAQNETENGAAWLFLRGKSLTPSAPDLLNIFSDVLLFARLDNRERFKQILLQEKAAQQQKLIPQGHHIVSCRLRAHFNEADWADERMNGISYLQFLRELEKKIDTGWQEILCVLEEMRQILLCKSAMVVNITVDERNWSHLGSLVPEFLELFPEKNSVFIPWTIDPLPDCEAMAAPSRVNYVGKGANLYEIGYPYSGSVHIITHFLRTTWLWDKVRVQGGAYGAFCSFDPLSGGFIFVSYRDPNLLQTIDIFDQAAGFLSGLEIGNDEISKSIIGAIGSLDAYMLPDAKGYISMQRYLNGNTDEIRQRMRDEMFSTTPADLKAFGAVLQGMKDQAVVKVLGSESAIKEANRANNNFLNVFKVL